MKFYRVAHLSFIREADGIPCGPYNLRNFVYDYDMPIDDMFNLSAEVLDKCLWDLSSEQTPPPHMEDLGDIRRDEFCGFHSIGALIRWFGPILPYLRDEGFSIIVYDIPDQYVRVGSHQALARLRLTSAKVDKVVDI